MNRKERIRNNWPRLAYSHPRACYICTFTSMHVCTYNLFCWRSNLSWWWHNFLEVRSENGCEKWHFLVWNRVRIWRSWRKLEIGTRELLDNYTKQNLNLVLFKPCHGLHWKTTGKLLCVTVSELPMHFPFTGRKVVFLKYLVFNAWSVGW